MKVSTEFCVGRGAAAACPIKQANTRGAICPPPRFNPHRERASAGARAQRNVAQGSAAQHSAAQGSAMEHRAAQRSTVQGSAAQRPPERVDDGGEDDRVGGAAARTHLLKRLGPGGWAEGRAGGQRAGRAVRSQAGFETRTRAKGATRPRTAGAR